jgi:hypothetical protein
VRPNKPAGDANLFGRFDDGDRGHEILLVLSLNSSPSLVSLVSLNIGDEDLKRIRGGRRREERWYLEVLIIGQGGGDPLQQCRNEISKDWNEITRTLEKMESVHFSLGGREEGREGGGE